MEFDVALDPDLFLDGCNEVRDDYYLADKCNSRNCQENHGSFKKIECKSHADQSETLESIDGHHRKQVAC